MFFYKKVFTKSVQCNLYYIENLHALRFNAILRLQSKKNAEFVLGKRCER